MIRKILIANRGEIASRIIRTCKKLNIQAVAIFSEADQQAPFRFEADESYLIGAAQVADSYMNIDKIFEIAKQANADAIHPGYGFLSENASFAERCKEEGLIFIGPSPDIIEKMGNKVTARNIMQEAGVPVVPGTEEAVADAEEAVSFAKKIGYPVMLKASAGGGGIGMHAVYSDEECQKAFEGNSERAAKFFGDGSMFIEKKIEQARHIEVQILADELGNAVHLFDRECSIQRRNQKVIEEAVSPFLSEEKRMEIGEIAVHAAKKIGYTNAGTLEFIVDQEENFYFLEMNTRIQVEHPVTEEITGIDIVAEQIRIAEGRALSFVQEDIKREGHAIEARVYAEDPVRFFPSPGTISSLSIPELAGVRNEVTVAEGYTVTPFYDPMIAKVSAAGRTRLEAADLLREALSKWELDGIKTNIPMIVSVLGSQAFKDGDTTTDFVEKYYLPTIK